MRQSHPTQRCAPCDLDWPAIPEYNLCARCQRCTYATTTEALPGREAAKKEAARFARIREFDAACDAQHVAEWDAWVIDMNDLLSRTQYIPDPPGAADLPGAATQNHGILGGHLNPPPPPAEDAYKDGFDSFTDLDEGRPNA